MTAPLREGNRVDLLDSGAEYFPALTAAIESAMQEIFLETYIYAEDATIDGVTDALARAARRGVAVRIVIDGFGTRDMSPRYRNLLAEAGATVLTYRPPLWRQPVRGLRRMHRKLALVDLRVAFIGGINLIDDWNTPDEIPPRYDYAVRVEGPVVADVARAAWHLWAITSYATFRRRQARRPEPMPIPPAAGTVRARFLIRDNVANRRDIENAYLAAIDGARANILLAMAYFLPSTRVHTALAAAAKRGVAVRIMFQGQSDHLLLKRAGEYLYRRLHKSGIEVIEYHKSFLHTKVAVIDGVWATVGSSNLDPFSLLLSREANLEIFDHGFVERLGASLEAAIRAGGESVTASRVAGLGWWSRMTQWASYRFTRAVIDWLNLAKER